MSEILPHTRSKVARLRSTPVLVISSIVVICIVFIVAPLIAKADAYQDQINALQNQNASNQSQVNGLASQASSYQNEISLLNSQIAGLQQAMAVNQDKQAQLQQEITANQQQIVQEKSSLADDVKTMYVSGSMTSFEELATSKSLSNYVDQQVAYNVVQDTINSTIAKINALQATLKQENAQLVDAIGLEKQQNIQLSNSMSQQQQLLAYNQQQQDSYNQQIQANQAKVAVLRQEQAAANAKLDSTGSLITSGSCGGSYPSTATGAYGSWGCGFAHTSDSQPGCSYYDNWGMCNRECVSYTAWMVYEAYGMSTVGFGNANQWPSSARAAGIATGSTPKVGSVAIYLGGSYGHAMWVVGVSGNMIHVYSYNDNYDGNFYDHWVSASGLTYIYFGG